ncbi:sulfotransferase family protein [Flavobacteriaceae bacterium GSB9]|nr:sulfotransferase family protein [Flavobacteriaceae bacterium GSB9]
MFNLFNKNKQKRHFNSDNISYTNNFVFIHIPKNAGTAISKSFGIETSKHNTVKEYISAMGEKKYGSMLSFAFVRNPFSRFISLYNYARMEESYYHSSINPDKAIYGKHMDYDILKHASIEEAALLLKAGKLVHNPPHTQWHTQCFWLKDQNKNLNVKYLGRFEDVDFHLRNLRQLLGCKEVRALSKLNASSKTTLDYRGLIDKGTRAVLEDVYKEDLETFNYDF